MYICIYMGNVYMYIYGRRRDNVCEKPVYVCVCVCMYLFVCDMGTEKTCVDIRVCMCVCMYVCICDCMYV